MTVLLYVIVIGSSLFLLWFSIYLIYQKIIEFKNKNKIDAAILNLYNWYTTPEKLMYTSESCAGRCPLCEAVKNKCVYCPWVVYEGITCVSAKYAICQLRMNPVYYKKYAPKIFNDRLDVLKKWMNIRGIEIPNGD